MLYLLLIQLLWLQLEAARTGCFLLREDRAVHCVNISMTEVAASYHTLQVPPTHDCSPTREEPLIKCTPSSTNHAPSVRSLVVEDCPHLLDEEVGVLFDLPTNLKSARFHRCPRPHLRTAYLTELDLSECGLDEVPRLSHVISLKRLLLRGNRISRLPTVSWWPPSLAELDLTDNRIGGNTLQAVLPPTLVSLSLSGNGLSSFVVPRGLRRLDLSRNKLRSVNVSQQEQLEYLDVRDNLITEPFRMPPHARIDIRGNPLHCECSNSTLLPLCTKDIDCPPDDAEKHEELNLIALSASTVEVQWKKRDGGALVYRREADPPLKMTLVSAPFIRYLQPSTAYIVCVARRTAPPAYTVDQSKCRRVVTRAARSPPRLLDLSVAATSVRLRWKAADDGGGKLEWRIRVKPSRSDSVPTDHRFSSDGGRLHEFAVTDLEPRTDYDVCVEEAETEEAGSCVTVHTEGEEPRTNLAVGLALGLCALGLVGVAAIALCHRRRGSGHHTPPEDVREGFKNRGRDLVPHQHPIAEGEQSGEDTEKELVEEACFEGGLKNYARSWSTLRLPHTAPPHPPLFRSFRNPCGYRDHLTSVTIYSSGHSEC